LASGPAAVETSPFDYSPKNWLTGVMVAVPLDQILSFL
jgi:hypothetical protein